MEESYPGCRTYIRKAFLKRSFPEAGLNGIVSSISTQTLKQYDSVYKKWWIFCANNNTCPYDYVLKKVITFLNEVFQTGCSYSLVNTHKSALALIFSINKNDENLIHRYLKGLRNIKPPRARYSNTWDPHSVLMYLKNLYPLEELSLENLTLKLVTLLALISAHRMQTLSKIKLDNIIKTEEGIQIFIDEKIKTSGRNTPQPVLFLPFFRNNLNLCLASTLEMYMQKTRDIRPTGLNYLILTIKKPFHAATPQTISRWVKLVLTRSGINTKLYTGYSIKHSAVSTAKLAGANIEVIRKAAGWSEKSTVFCAFYNKPIISPADTFAKAVLEGAGINID